MLVLAQRDITCLKNEISHHAVLALRECGAIICDDICDVRASSVTSQGVACHGSKVAASLKHHQDAAVSRLHLFDERKLICVAQWNVCVSLLPLCLDGDFTVKPVYENDSYKYEK